MKRDLPKYKITIEDEYSEGKDLGISMIAFTSKPAIITKGMAFSEDDSKKLYFNDDLKYRICAPVMVPMEIYRCDSNEEYYVQFTEEEIDTIHQKFMSNLTNKNIFNSEHNSDDVIPAFVLEAWIVETPETDKAFQTYGIKVPKGTLMMTTQITDKEVYNELVKTDRVGYSIEGFLGLKLSEIKNKETKMEENKLNLPAGEYTSPDGKVIVVAEDGTFEIKETVKEEMAQDIVEEKKVEEVKEELAQEVKEEEIVKEEELAEGDVPVEEVKETITYTKEEVDAKFDELYKLIADLSVEEVKEEVKEEELKSQKTELSVNERFEAFNRFFVNTKVEL